MREFEGKTAVVTGAASGMGRAFAERFARAGMHVVLADIEEEALKTAVRELEQEEHRVIGVVTNTMSRDSMQALARRAIDEFGKVHIVCNNAGVTSRGDAGAAARRGVWEIPQSDWDWLVGVNFWGVLYGLQVFIPHMLEHGEEGHIVNTASLAGLIPGGGRLRRYEARRPGAQRGSVSRPQGARRQDRGVCPLPGVRQHGHLQSRAQPPRGVRERLTRVQRRRPNQHRLGAAARQAARGDRRDRLRGHSERPFLHLAPSRLGRDRAQPRRTRPRPRGSARVGLRRPHAPNRRRRGLLTRSNQSPGRNKPIRPRHLRAR